MSDTIQTINLQPDYEGKVTATLISKSSSEPSTNAILYIHGYVDYFFQNHMAQAFTTGGFNFYALELRKYGRSLLPHQHPNYARSIFEYYEEIDRAMEQLIADGNDKIIMVGHSTGGLVASMYASSGKYRGRITALELNSPFFEFNVSLLNRIGIVTVTPFARIAPYSNLKGALSPLYGESVNKNYKGEWDYNLEWKPINGFPSYLLWIRAIYKAQRMLHKGLDVQCPVLVMHSARSSWPKSWNEDIRITDIVLNVKDIKKYGKRLGSNVSFFEVPNGMHDLVLSRKDVRDKVLSYMVSWAQAKVA